MRVLAVNVGSPKQVPVRDGFVLTSIFKSPVQGSVAVVRHNIAGDQQSDLRVHGGPYKAVYAYPSEHYQYWKEQLPGMDLPYGIFGENLTTEGLAEEEILVGDQLRVGSALLQVTQPRMPCFKLGVRFGRPDIVKRFWESGLAGFYFSVLEEGHLAAGDPISKTQQQQDGISVSDVVRLYRGDETRPEIFERALKAPLFGGWKEDLRERYLHRHA